MTGYIVCLKEGLGVRVRVKKKQEKSGTWNMEVKKKKTTRTQHTHCCADCVSLTLTTQPFALTAAASFRTVAQPLPVGSWHNQRKRELSVVG